jgi:hemolysin D
VKEGEVLIELAAGITSAALQASSERYAYNRLERVRLEAEVTQSKPDYRNFDVTWVALQDETRRARESAYMAKVGEAKAQFDERTHALAAAQAALQKYREMSIIAAERENSSRPLVESGAISRLDYLELKQQLSASTNDFAAQLRTVDQQRAAVLEAKKRIAQIEHEHRAEIYGQLGDKVSSAPVLKGEMDRSREQHELKWLKAPVSGWVQKVNVATVGGVASPSQSLVTIVPEGTPLIVEATLSNDDIGFVKVGQDVRLKVDTFPFQQYGSLKGTLTWISPDAEERATAGGKLQTATEGEAGRGIENIRTVKEGYVYKVHIKPAETAFLTQQGRAEVQAGMTVQADIVTDQRRIIAFLLSPIVKNLDEAVSLR